MIRKNHAGNRRRAGRGSVVLLLLLSMLVTLLPQAAYADGGDTSLPHIVKVNSTERYGIALGSDGSVWGWGKNDRHQLGLADTSNVQYPVRISFPESPAPVIKDIASGDSFTLALDQAGDVWIWGEMSRSETPLFSTPVKAAGLSGIQAISAGSTFGMALDAQGQVLTWGRGSFNELGQGDGVTVNPGPAPVLSGAAPLTGVTGIAAGMAEGLAVTGDGKLYAWGKKGFAIFGGEDVTSAQQVPLIPRATKVISNYNALFAYILTDSGIYAWGDNQVGQLGVETETTAYASPVPVTSLNGKNVRDISVGSNHALALLADGTVWGTGNNSSKQIVDNYAFKFISFEQQASLSGVSAINAGYSRSFAFKPDGSVWAWGSDRISSFTGEVYAGMLGTGHKGYQYGAPLRMLDLTTYDLSPKPLGSLTAQMIYSRNLKMTYDIPVPSEFNKIVYEIYSKESGALVVSETDDRHADDMPTQNYTLHAALPPGFYTVKAYTKNGAAVSEPVTYDIGGAGIEIKDGSVSLSVPVTMWGKSGRVAEIPLRLIDFENGGAVIQGASSSGGAADFAHLYSEAFYRLEIDAGQLADGTAYRSYEDSIRFDAGETTVTKPVVLLPANLPAELYLNETDSAAGTLTGEAWWTAAGESAFTEYRLYFENASGEKLGSPIITHGTGEGWYDVNFLNVPVPEGAVQARLYVWNGTTEKPTPAAAEIWDYPSYLPQDPSMEDLDPSENRIQAVVRWKKALSEGAFTNYVIYRNEIPVARVPASGASGYSVTLAADVLTASTGVIPVYSIGVERADKSVGPVKKVVWTADRSDAQTPIVPTGWNSSWSVPVFTDYDPAPGEIGGTLTWTPPPYSWGLTAYDVYFMNADNQYVGTAGRVYVNNSFGSGRSAFSFRFPAHTRIPQGAVRIGIAAREGDVTREAVAAELPDLTLRLSLSDPEWSRTPVTVSINGSEQLKAGQELQVQYGSTGTWETYVGERTIDTEGITTVSMRVVGLDGEAGAARSSDVRIDRTAPSAPAIAPSTSDWSSVPVSFTLTDGADTGGSGVLASRYKIGADGAWTDYPGHPVAVNVVGETPVYAVTVDRAGNISAQSTTMVRLRDNVLAFDTTGYDLYVGDSRQTVVQAVYTGGAIDVTRFAAFTSANPEIAEVSGDGIVTARSAGSTVVKATYGGQEATLTVHVTAPPQEPTLIGIAFDQGNYSLLAGNTKPLQIAAEYSNGSRDVTAFTEFRVTNPAIASVHGGVLTGLSSGTTVVTATYGGKTAAATITVTVRTDDPLPPVSPPSSGEKPPAPAADTVSVIQDGKPVQATVNEDKLKSGTIVVQLPSSSNSVAFQLPSALVTRWSGQNPDAVLEFKAPFGTYTLPLQAIAGQEAKSYTVTIRKTDDSVGAKARQAFLAAGLDLLTDLFEFEVEAVLADGKMVKLTSFDRYIARSLTIGRTVNSAAAMGVVFDSDTGEIRPVPTFFHTENGQTIATIVRRSNSLYAVVGYGKHFDDVAGHWSASDVEMLASKLLVQGKTVHAFDPDGAVTRAEFAAMLSRGLGLAEDKEDAPFRDIAGQWFAKEVSRAYHAGLVDGYADGKFRPNERITRQEIVVMTIRALAFAGQKPEQAAANRLDRYGDHDAVAPWAKQSFAAAAELGIVQGNESGQLSPAANATRAEAAVMLKRLLESLHFIN